MIYLIRNSIFIFLVCSFTIAAAEVGNESPSISNSICFENGTISTTRQSTEEIKADLGSLNDRHAIVQLDNIPSASEKSQLASVGIELLGYLPYYAWYAKINNGVKGVPSGIRYITKIDPWVKLSNSIADYSLWPEGLVGDDSIRISVIFFKDVSKDEILTVIVRYGTGRNIFKNTWEITIGKDYLGRLATEDKIQCIDNVPAPPEASMDMVRQAVHANEVQEAPYNLHGAGFVAGVWDAGTAGPHPDFDSRTIRPDGARYDYHATAVIGAMAGNGSRSQSCGDSAFQWRGIATEATILSYDWNNRITELDSAINYYGTILSQNSWGEGLCGYGDPSNTCLFFGDYGPETVDYDMASRGEFGVPITVIGSAGNNGNCTFCQPYLDHFPFHTVTGPVATAKNGLSVSGTIANDDNWWAQSSRGPTKDGRMKPDISSPACHDPNGILLTGGSNCYGLHCGTSFSAPVVSGAVILVYEAYHNLYGYNPLPSTVRAVLYHSVDDFGNPGPDYCFGYGRLNITKAIDLVQDDGGLGHKILIDSIENGQSKFYEMNVGPGRADLKVTLVWDDVPAQLLVAVTLVNDLDLVLISPSYSGCYPWHLDWNNPANTATTGVDVRNNSEQVFLENPESGRWIAQISAPIVPMGPQVFTLIGDFTPIEVSGNGSISGRVFSEDSIPLNNVSISTLRNTAFDTSDVFGNFFFDNLPAGAYALTFSKNLFRDSTVLGFYCSNGDTTNRDVYLRYVPGAVSGIVTENRGYPVAGGIVSALVPAISDTTGSNGSYLLSGLDLGIHDFSFSCRGYFDTIITGVSILPADTTVLNIIARVIPCQLVIGDVNGSNSYNGLDVTYGVSYFKGGPSPPFNCNCPPYGFWYVSGDVNGSCSYNGLDVTYGVAYFKGGSAPITCPDCPPSGLLELPDPREKQTPGE